MPTDRFIGFHYERTIFVTGMREKKYSGPVQWTSAAEYLASDRGFQFRAECIFDADVNSFSE